MALPYLSDEVFVNIASSLDIPALGALGCTAQRFTTRTIADPTHSEGEVGRKGGVLGWGGNPLGSCGSKKGKRGGGCDGPASGASAAPC